MSGKDGIMRYNDAISKKRSNINGLRSRWWRFGVLVGVTPHVMVRHVVTAA